LCPAHAGQIRRHQGKPHSNISGHRDAGKQANQGNIRLAVGASSKEYSEDTGIPVETIVADLAIGEEPDQREISQLFRDQTKFLTVVAELIGSPCAAGEI
jgi:hypothetical protein